ncbi:Dyp-type peroxidase [Marinomonas pollencensis]|uniref:Putative iron-dependent peroxidase n=1 Tax=Marinomonas pollencensis TaxID=491954 RepID=A0A3E0DSG5_9GAMM|nr:Dyp-type peroxidase [Marinomonas pollencensis]REG86489.1 putative iron-dependent peroxidase [Marinomonas pollencensis]
MTQAYQTGIIPEASSDALFITFNLVRDRIAQAKHALASSTDIVHDIAQQFPDAALYASIGLNHAIWPLFDNTKKPQGLAPFPHFKNQQIEVNETAGELVFHIRSMRRDVSYQLANALFQAFDKSLELVEEVSCFKYLDNRDLTGFVDGTENPEGEKRKQVALVGAEDPDFEGGSYLNLMRFVHDLDKWEHQDLKSQEDIYGRTKYSNEEYAASQKSPHAHTKRTSLKDSNGQSLEILRHSMPFASLTEKGLMFASYSKTPNIFNQMLESMVKGDEQGHYDHLMRFTTAHTGNAFFIPATRWFTTLLD